MSEEAASSRKSSKYESIVNDPNLNESEEKDFKLKHE